MDNSAFVPDNFRCSRIINAEEKLLLKKLNEAFATKNLEKFTMLLQRPMKKSWMKLKRKREKKMSKQENNEVFKRFNLVWNFTQAMQAELENGKIKHEPPFDYHELLSQRILCYRKTSNDLSLLEKIMQEPQSGNFIAFVWSECDFWRDSSYLTTINEQGKVLMDFIVESESDENLFMFLIHDLKDRTIDDSKCDKNYFLKIKSEQFMRCCGISLFSRIYMIIVEDPAKFDQCLVIIHEVLKEMKQIVDIRREVQIDAVLTMKEHIQHEILKIMIKYWKTHSKDYYCYRNYICDINPFFKLYISLKEYDEDEFEECFCDYLDFMRQTHSHIEFNQKLQEDSNLLMTFALNHGMKKAMQILIRCYSVDVNKSCEVIDVAINNEYAMLKLLEKGYYIGYEDEEICKDGNWINGKVFEQFLDSRVTTVNGSVKSSTLDYDEDRGIQIDYTFMISPEIRPITMDKDENNHKLIFNAGMAPLEWILSNEKLRYFITHPVLSTFINLKANKFSLIYSLNLFMFCMFYVIPFILVFVYYDPKDGSHVLKIFVPALIATFYLTLREAIQFFWIIDSKVEYFKKKSNKLEMLMITSSWCLLYSIVTKSYHTYQVSSAFIILLGAIELLSILPYATFSIYMFMLKEVTMTFLKFFTVFILIILAFTFSFYAILKPIKTIQEKKVVIANQTLTLTSSEAVFKNFEHPFTSFIKTILMFAGDFSVDPYKGVKKSESKWPRDLEQNGARKNDLNFIERTTKKILTFIVNRYIFLHKMDNLFIDLKYKHIFYKIEQKKEPILRMINGTVKTCSLEDTTYERLVALSKRKDKNTPDIGERLVVIENDVKILIEQMESLKNILVEKTSESIVEETYSNLNLISNQFN
ncbi:CLUMA_CG005804, isoform A [Clunio marinus]|uniref:CLUMA_CG005804, isoform A n=1 Tax=Clunio marinus TaxID=568069 RepID=A0A1J1HVQ3_9DIPT|nr:CLUMA_CG005804, isoform A [Clunio marinus]